MTNKQNDTCSQLPSLIRVFAVCIRKLWILRYPMNTQRRLILLGWIARLIYSKTCLKRPRKKKDKTQILMTNGSLMQVKSIAECSPWSILQYFWPALSDSWSLNPIFGLFESGRFYQVLLYLQWMKVILCLLSDWLIYESLVMHIHHNLSVSWHPSVFWRKV